jgi:hypothetical protein
VPGRRDGGLTMFVDAIGRAIAAAPTTELDRLAQKVWAAHGAGLIDDGSAQAAAEAIQARHRAEKGAHRLPGAQGLCAPFSGKPPKPKRPTSPDRRASIERRRRLVASGPLPPAIAARFTWGEIAVMRIVGDECRAHGVCTLHIDAIAARAGVHRTTVQNALREAQGRGPIPGQPIISVQERRRRGQRSLTNVIRIVSAEWRDWLRKGRRPLGSNCSAVRNLSSTDTSKKERKADAPSRRDVISRGGSPHLYGKVVSGGSRKGARR